MATFRSKYNVMHKIGEGSFAEVVICEDKCTRQCYAAKKLKKRFKSEEFARQCPELIAMQKLSRHPNVVHMMEYYYDSFSGEITFIFELMDMSIYEYLTVKKRSIPEVRAKYYLYQILKGLDHIHKNGFFHRDIKPENILIKSPKKECEQHAIAPFEIVKIGDLGSIRGIYSEPPYTEYISTRWYRSPECLLTAGYYGPKMDIWATGCVFYEMLTQRPLFPGADEIDQLAKIHAILGTPSARFLNKIKAKSRNWKNFPKQQGIGLHNALHNTSDCGEIVLKLMLQYDPDQRVNVKRLLDHKYFDEYKQQELVNKYNAANKSRQKLSFRNRGDYGTSLDLNRFASPDPRRTHRNSDRSKRSNQSNRSDATKHKHKTMPNIQRKSSQSRRSSNSTIRARIKRKPSPALKKEKILVVPPEKCRMVKSRTCIRKETGPLVSQNEMKTWGVNPNILRPKDEPCMIKRVTEPHQNKQKPLKKKKTIKEKDDFNKTTSYLLQSSKNTEVKHTQQFQSKSFVLPWRMPGNINMETLTDLINRTRFQK